MSHFTVLCVTNNFEDVVEQLEPYCELECSLSREEIKNDHRATFVEEMSTEELEKDFIRVKNDYPETYYETIEEFAEEYHGYQKSDEEDVWGRWTNPKSKWDWYSIGGRWSGTFKVKDNPKYPDDLFVGRPGAFDNKPPEGYVDSIRLCDIDFEGMKADSVSEAKKNWKEAQQQISKGDKTAYTSYFNYFMYGISQDETEKSYIEKHSKFTSYALLKDGEWYAKGKMGWFGMSSDEKENWSEELDKLIKSSPEDTLLTIVDCHI